MPSPSDPLDLHRRYGGAAFITGASSGIGEAFARRLARAGFDLVLVARRADRLETIASELSAAHSMAIHVLSQDLGERDGPARAVAAADALGVEIGVLVSNAGFGTAPRTNRTTRCPPPVRKCASSEPRSPREPVIATRNRGRSRKEPCRRRSLAVTAWR